MGLHVKSDLYVAKNATYASCKSIQEWFWSVRVLKRIKESDHFALMFDETTDCSVSEQLAIHGRYWQRIWFSKNCYLKITEIDALGNQQSLATETSVHVSVCADTITNRIHESNTENEGYACTLGGNFELKSAYFHLFLWQPTWKLL